MPAQLLSPVQLVCDPRFLCPWDFPGKNPGAGYHFLLQSSIAGSFKSKWKQPSCVTPGGQVSFVLLIHVTLWSHLHVGFAFREPPHLTRHKGTLQRGYRHLGAWCPAGPGGYCLHQPGTAYKRLHARAGVGAAAGRDAISLWKGPLLWIWTNLNSTGTEGLCEMCLWNSCDRYPRKACVYKWECVRRRTLRGLLGAPFLTLISTYSRSLTGELGANIYIQTVLGPLMEGSFTRSVHCKYIHQTMLLHREGTIKTRFKC